MGTALPLIAIYQYTKFYLNANSSFSYLPDRRIKRRLYASPFGEQIYSCLSAKSHEVDCF